MLRGPSNSIHDVVLKCKYITNLIGSSWICRDENSSLVSQTRSTSFVWIILEFNSEKPKDNSISLFKLGERKLNFFVAYTRSLHTVIILSLIPIALCREFNLDHFDRNFLFGITRLYSFRLLPYIGLWVQLCLTALVTSFIGFWCMVWCTQNWYSRRLVITGDYAIAWRPTIKKRKYNIK